jgi:serpin B
MAGIEPGLRGPLNATEEETSFGQCHNDFALALGGQLFREPGNVFFSPFSIHTALGMALIGARGETAVQMSRALRAAAAQDNPNAAVCNVLQRLAAAGQNELTQANSLWGQEGQLLQAGFLNLIARHYGAEMHVVDFRRAASAARIINRWV